MISTAESCASELLCDGASAADTATAGTAGVGGLVSALPDTDTDPDAAPENASTSSATVWFGEDAAIKTTGTGIGTATDTGPGSETATAGVSREMSTALLDPTDDSEEASLANARAWIGASALDGQAICFAPNARRSIFCKTPRLPEPNPDGTYDNGKVYIPNIFAIDYEIFLKQAMNFVTDGHGLVCLYGADKISNGIPDVAEVPGVNAEFMQSHPELFDVDCKDARKQVALIGYGRYGKYIERAQRYVSKMGHLVHGSTGGGGA